MPKMTKPLLAKLAKLEAACENATQTIYAAAAPRNDVRFNDCYAMASEATQDAYKLATWNLENFHQDMISQGRAWRVTSKAPSGAFFFRAQRTLAGKVDLSRMSATWFGLGARQTASAPESGLRGRLSFKR